MANDNQLNKEKQLKELGERIRAIRIRSGLTMEEFIKEIDGKDGKGRSGTVNNWETGKNSPNKKRLKKIAEIGNIPVNYLTTGKKEDNDRELKISVIKKYGNSPLTEKEKSSLYESSLESDIETMRDNNKNLLEAADFFKRDKLEKFNYDEITFSGAVSRFLATIEHQKKNSLLLPFKDLINKYIDYLDKKITLSEFQKSVDYFKNSIPNIDEK
ncbi:helix-turn-helix domain-containing protein [Liquorilactobacillus nagelii]|uniref:helix-turn-helix domain-containing protein n=1 Tax=Liquorilactobacillus nagelii TaxID=82688 RepID=UPI0039E9E77D